MNTFVYCYVGGGKILDLEMAPIVDKLKQVVSDRNYHTGTIIPASEGKKDKWFDIGEKLFTEMGLENILRTDPFLDESKAITANLKNSEVIFITGGSSLLVTIAMLVTVLIIMYRTLLL